MPVTLLPAGDPASARRLLEELTAGRPVGVPTETVYGLLADVRYSDNVAYLRASGPSPMTSPLAIHLGPSYPLPDLTGRASTLFRRLVRKAWPGPLTIILEQPAAEFGPAFQAWPDLVKREITETLPNGVCAVQLRCPQDVWLGALLDSAGAAALGPLVAVGLSLADSPAVEAEEARQALETRNARWTGSARGEQLVDAGRTRYARPSTVVRVRGENWTLVRAGVWDERTVRRLARLSLLFVCTGNTCRSPMAAALARQAISRKLGMAPDELENRGIDIGSAGVAAFEGFPASPPAVRVLRRRGVDLSAHRSRRLSASLVAGCDLVLTMTPSQQQDVVAQFPTIADKIRMLGERPVPDPVGGDEEDYEAIARELDMLVARLVEDLDL